MEHDVVITGDGLRLRPFRADAPTDIDFLVRMGRDEGSRRWSRSLRSIDDADSAHRWLERRLGDGTSREWIVEDDEAGRVLGRVGLHRDSDDADPEVGYWTLPEERGAGVARRAARLVARHAHDDMGEQRVALVHAVANPASCRVALAASYRYEGTHRGALDHGDGVRWDMHVHARLLADAWDAIPPAVPAGGPPVLPGERVTLRPWRLDDAEALIAAARDPLIERWNPIAVSTPADVRAYVDGKNLGMDSLGWAVADPRSDDVVGYASLHRIDVRNSSGEVGYWVAPAARGAGVAAAAVGVVTAYACTTLGLARLELFHAVDNPASCRVAEKAGFALEGRRRKGYRYPDGQLLDEHLHALVRA